MFFDVQGAYSPDAILTVSYASVGPPSNSNMAAAARPMVREFRRTIPCSTTCVGRIDDHPFFDSMLIDAGTQCKPGPRKRMMSATRVR